MKKVAILQSNYIPWRGYFDIINMVDEFIFYDDVQYTKNDWRNRNKIKTPRGAEWLTVPCGSSIRRLICEVALNNNLWQEKHWEKIKEYYRHSAFFPVYKDFFENIYLESKWNNLSELNQYIIKIISTDILGITTIFNDSRNFNLVNYKTERLLELLVKVGADCYISGTAAKNYLNEVLFRNENIKIYWMDYSGYPEYNQLFPPFEHQVSIIDLIFNVGPDAIKYMKSYNGKDK
jgi:hypothetical protein